MPKQPREKLIRLGNLLTAMRERQGLTQAEAVSKVWPDDNLNSKRQLLTRWENGRRRPGAHPLTQYLDGFARDAEEVLEAWSLAGYPIAAVRSTRSDISKRLKEIRQTTGKIRAQVRDSAESLTDQMTREFSDVSLRLEGIEAIVAEAREAVSGLESSAQKQSQFTDVDLSPYDLTALEYWIMGSHDLVNAWRELGLQREHSPFIFWGLLSFLPALDVAGEGAPGIRVTLGYFMVHFATATASFVELLGEAAPDPNQVTVPKVLLKAVADLPLKIYEVILDLYATITEAPESHVVLRTEEGRVLYSYSPDFVKGLIEQLGGIRNVLVRVQGRLQPEDDAD